MTPLNKAQAINFILFFIASILIFPKNAAWATDQIGTLTQVQGAVKLFTHPSKALPKESSEKDHGQAPHALFEGEYFLVQDAHIGDRLEKGNIVRTSPGSKARVVFDNGDQINVGTETAYRVTWDQDAKQGHAEIQLAYGKLRGIIEKGGPRSHLRVKTRTAVMGVRGTDFFIAQGGADEGTEVTIMRGAVEVAPRKLTPTTQAKNKDKEADKPETQLKPIEVKAGYSAEILPVLPPASDRIIAQEEKKQNVNPKIELKKTTQEEFAGIQKSSTLILQANQPPASQEAKKNVEELEKKASMTALKDIQAHDKKLFATLEKQGNQTITIEDINKAAIQSLYKEAPKAPSKRKPFKSEMEDLNDGAYEKYFKKAE